MLYQLYETQRSLMEPFADFAQAAAKLYSNPLSPFGQNQFTQRISASYDLLHRLGKDYEKPVFGISTVNVDGVDVAINERIEVNKPITIGDTSVHMIGHGYAAVVTVRDGNGDIRRAGDRGWRRGTPARCRQGQGCGAPLRSRYDG